MLLVQGEEEGWKERDGSCSSGREAGISPCGGPPPQYLPVQPSLFCFCCSRQHMVVPKPLDVVSPEESLGCSPAVVLPFLS